MITLLPPLGTQGAAVLAGRTDAAGLRHRGVVVVKACYTLTAAGTGPLVPGLAEGSAPHALRLADAGTPILDGTKTVGFTLTAEADIALEKTRTDIVVEGMTPAPNGGLVRIDGATWLRRAADATSLGDTATHLFGWHGRSEAYRAAPGEDPPLPPGAEQLPGFGPLANNFYRRSQGFSAPGNAGPLPPGGIVAIHQTADGSDTPYRFALPTDRFRARLRLVSPLCPDTPGRWRIAETIGLVPDTLIVVPADNRATLIWRGGWDWDRYPTASYRAVEILREET